MSNEDQKQKGREVMAKVLESLAQDVRTGAVDITNCSQEMPASRFWADGRWEFFRLDDTKLGLTYFNVEARKAEQARLAQYLDSHPRAESHGPIVGPHGTLEVVQDPHDEIWVFLNDKVQGSVIEADAEQGYILKKTGDGSVITMKGKVRITFNGQDVVRAEVGNRKELKNGG